MYDDELASGLVVAATKPLLQPIHRLHVELLEMIFNIYVGQLIEQYHGTRRFIPCTHVCHTWRAVALSSARLWRCIDITEPEFSKEFLIRSKQAPISIMTSIDMHSTLSYIGKRETLRQHAERIYEINVILGCDDMRSFLTDLGFTLPALSTLSLGILAHEGVLNFTCAIPNIRVVEIRSVALPWDTCMNLSNLSIAYLNEACSPSVSQILTIMMQCPALEYVYLGAIKPVIGAATILQTPIELLHLRTLDLDLTSDRITLHILSCISIPSFATINIHNPVPSLGSVIPRHAQHLRNLSCNEGSILYLTRRMVDFYRIVPERTGSRQALLFVSITEMSDTTLSSLVETIDSLRVVTLDINVQNISTIESIMNALPHSFLATLTYLTTLNMGYAGSKCFEKLIQPQETLSSTPHNGVICPQLKNVIIQQFIDTADTRLDSLIAWLKQRNQFGVRLHKLQLNGCEVSQDMMDELRSLVDEVIVRRW